MTAPTLALIQARMSSSRLPGKVLEPLQGVPLIVYMARRASRAQRLDGVVVVTSADCSDDPLAAALEAAAVPVFRGDLNDVLKRYTDAAAAHGAGEIVRLTGDCPLIDPTVIDAVIDARRASGADYASNVDPPTYPDGLDVECFTRATLVRADVQADRASEREHVTLWMRSEAAGLRRVNHYAIADFSALRLTIDYADDLSLVRRLMKDLPVDGRFDLFDVLRAVSADAALQSMNPHERNEGLAQSLARERSAAA
jgi:spore coat polysaccharide biosynthesis protein SpsF